MTTDVTPSHADLAELLACVKTIAMVGASNKPERPSYQVMEFLQGHGYRVIPVNPGLAGQTLLGETVVSALAEIDGKVDMVDVFRAAKDVPPIVAEAAAIGANVFWMQLGVVNEDAAQQARAAGMAVVMDRCPKIELARAEAL